MAANDLLYASVRDLGRLLRARETTPTSCPACSAARLTISPGSWVPSTSGRSSTATTWSCWTRDRRGAAERRARVGASARIHLGPRGVRALPSLNPGHNQRRRVAHPPTAHTAATANA